MKPPDLTKYLRRTALALSASLILVSSCGTGGEGDTKPEASTSTASKPVKGAVSSEGDSTASAPEGEGAAAPEGAAAAAGGGADKGDFKPSYGATKNAQFVEWKDYLKQGEYLEDMSKWLNASLNLPHDIGFTTGECGEVNAFYDPNTKKVILCYEFMEYLEDLFKDDYKNKKQEERDEAVTNALTFVAYHEVGHALVDVLDLPITGKEEDAVDQLSTVLLCEGTEPDEKMQAVDGAMAFLNMSAADENDLERQQIWGAHSMSDQRFFNIITLIYGSDPKFFDFIPEAKDGILPAGRANGAVSEWNRASKAWNTILSPHMKG